MKLGPKGWTAAFLLPLALIGCGGVDGDEPEEPTPLHEASVHCSGLPGFVVLYADAVVTACFQAPPPVQRGRQSGTIIYTTHAAPAVVLDWYSDQAEAKALTPGPASETSYSARDGDKRTLTVSAEARGSGTRVTLNWGQAR